MQEVLDTLELLLLNIVEGDIGELGQRVEDELRQLLKNKNKEKLKNQSLQTIEVYFHVHSIPTAIRTAGLQKRDRGTYLLY